MQLPGYTDFDNDYSNEIGRVSIISIVAMIIITALCALVLLLSQSSTINIYIIAILAVILEATSTLPAMITAHKMNSIPIEQQVLECSRNTKNIKISIMISVVILIIATYVLLEFVPSGT